MTHLSLAGGTLAVDVLMADPHLIACLSNVFHASLLWWLPAAYALAAVAPGFGLFIRRTSLGELTVFQETLSLSLPRISHFLLVTLVLAFTLSLATFVSAFWLGRFLEVDAAQEASLMYELGMNNNGMGLVLASASLAAYPQVMLPIIFYNLVQHVVAGSVHFSSTG